MFCVGSPLGVFLTLRGIKPGDDDVEDHVLPRSVCKKMFNIYHPADPVVSGLIDYLCVVLVIIFVGTREGGCEHFVFYDVVEFM